MHEVVMGMRLRRPQTWPGRVAVASVLLAAAGEAMPHFLPSRTPGKIVADAAGYIFLAAVVMMLVSGTIHDLRKKPEGAPDIGRMGPLGAGIALGLSQALVFLTTQGNMQSAHVNRTGTLPRSEALFMTTGLLYLLLFCPEIIRRKKPFDHASEQAQRLVPAGLAAGAAIVTGTYLLTLHFFNEPLANVPLGPLAASIVAVMALLTPFYQLTVRASWRYGLADLLDPTVWWDKGWQVADEARGYLVRQALPAMEEKHSADTKDATGSTEHLDQNGRLANAGPPYPRQERRYPCLGSHA